MRRTCLTVVCLSALILAAPFVVLAQAGALPPAAPAARPALTPAAGAFALPAPADPLAPAPDTAAFKSYKGRINVDIVNVRCGPGLYYYPVATLESGAQVTVGGIVDEWAALGPIEAVFGLMKKADLTVAADNVSGTVASPTARVYASSRTATRHWCVMKTLVQGDKVKVLGPAGDDRVRIAPPDGSRIYVLSKYVSSGALPAEATGGGTTEEPKYPILNVDVKPGEADPQYETFKTVDAALDEELKKPVEARDYTPLIDQFKQVAEKAEKDYVKRAALGRVSRLEALAERQADYLKILKLGDDLDSDLSKMQAQRAEDAAALQIGKSGVKPPFAATGVVARLTSLEGVDHPVKFKLVGKDGRPIVVLKSAYYDLASHVGKAVGVRGAKTYYKEWRIYLVTVDDIEILE